MIKSYQISSTEKSDGKAATQSDDKAAIDSKFKSPFVEAKSFLMF